jgi:ferredoxin-fold anticodon binding domain-containing protein
MIDNIRTFVINKHRFENHIEDNNLMDLTSKLNMITGELMEYPKKGKVLNLEVNITPLSASIIGSIHKYKNLLEDNGNQNYDDFNFCQIQETIGGLIKKFNIQRDTKLTNLEFGFNIAVSKDPQIIMDNNVLMNNFKAPNRNEKFNGKGDYKEFKLTDYRIKIYNKSKQFNIEANVLRVELKIVKKRLLNSLGIHCLEDLLDKEALRSLFKLFIEHFEGINIVDYFEQEKVPEKDRNKLNRYMSPIYWIRIKSEKSPKQISGLKTDFTNLLNKYKLLKMKNEIREKLNAKFIELLDSDCFNSNYGNVA